MAIKSQVVRLTIGERELIEYLRNTELPVLVAVGHGQNLIMEEADNIERGAHGRKSEKHYLDYTKGLIKAYKERAKALEDLREVLTKISWEE